MATPIVFIASSSEGLNIVEAVQKLLDRGLAGTADVRSWPNTFQLTMAYIESLERLLYYSDFAVVVLTPDDRTTSRNIERSSPRDNVIFELGLFFGRLSRKRCFLIRQHRSSPEVTSIRRSFWRFWEQRGASPDFDADLKLPSDLLGIETATFSISQGEDIETALDSACSQIVNAIRDALTELPSRPRLGDKEQADQTAMRKFGDRITGTWWERIKARGEAPALSFLTIEIDEIHSSVKLGGKAYNGAGVHVATVRVAAARLEGNRVVYVRECQRLDAETTAWLPGLAEITFTDSSDVIDQGDGKFWESDESRPQNTVIKHVELRRNRDQGDALTMRNGSDQEKRDLVRKRLDDWEHGISFARQAEV